MADIELEIRGRDWLYILLTGISFGLLMAMLGYRILELSLVDGALFGALLGFFITLYALIFITGMNRQLLPRIRRGLWVPVAVLFSFLSGFLGTLTSLGAAAAMPIKVAAPFAEAPLEIAAGIGALTYAVGLLLYRFVRMRNVKEAVDRHYIQSRLRSLETQLNPHFLYNALNSVAELIHQDPKRAEDAVLKLSAFLRSTMKESPMIPLREELQNARDYVELENIRRNGAITLLLPPAPYPALDVPKFSIQLLIENAIKHGMHTGKGLQITVAVDAAAGSIRVANDGRAMETTGFGIGLGNLKERLGLLCGGALEIENRDPVTFVIRLGGCYEHTDR